jgi:hypothetical protein
MLGLIGASMALGLLAGCGDGDTGDANRPQDKQAQARGAKLVSNISALTRPDRSNADFVQELRSHVKLIDGLLLVESTTSPGLWVLSVNTPWVIQCGPLLSLVFGGSVKGSPEGVSNEVDITLSLALMTDERCRELAPVLGREVNLILSGK